jgi:hypothetical protein
MFISLFIYQIFNLGYVAHIPGIKSANIFGQSYAKSTAIAIKNEYCNKGDLPPNERYQTISNIYFTDPKIRSIEEGRFFYLIIYFFIYRYFIYFKRCKIKGT